MNIVFAICIIMLAISNLIVCKLLKNMNKKIETLYSDLKNTNIKIEENFYISHNILLKHIGLEMEKIYYNNKNRS